MPKFGPLFRMKKFATTSGRRPIRIEGDTHYWGSRANSAKITHCTALHSFYMTIPRQLVNDTLIAVSTACICEDDDLWPSDENDLSC